MFTVKWFTNPTDYRCLEVKEFEVYYRDNQMRMLMHISDDSTYEWEVKSADKVFIENNNGKTVDVINGQKQI